MAHSVSPARPSFWVWRFARILCRCPANGHRFLPGCFRSGSFPTISHRCFTLIILSISSTQGIFIATFKISRSHDASKFHAVWSNCTYVKVKYFRNDGLHFWNVDYLNYVNNCVLSKFLKLFLALNLQCKHFIHKSEFRSGILVLLDKTLMLQNFNLIFLRLLTQNLKVSWCVFLLITNNQVRLFRCGVETTSVWHRKVYVNPKKRNVLVR